MPTIALVDDNEEVLDLMKYMLLRQKICATVVYNSPDRLLHDIAEGFDPDCIITDFYMPGMNGIELLDQVAMLREIPGIVITGYPEGVELVSSKTVKYPVLCKGDGAFYNKLLETVKATLCSPIQDTGHHFSSEPVMTLKP